MFLKILSGNPHCPENIIKVESSWLIDVKIFDGVKRMAKFGEATEKPISPVYFN